MAFFKINLVKRFLLLYLCVNKQEKQTTMAKFRKVELTISRANGYGRYCISANYKGKHIEVHTTNSECFDWLHDDSNKHKHTAAKRYAYRKIVNAYKDMKFC